MALSLAQTEKLKKIFEENGVCLAYIFGSAARKELKELGPLSDIDFAILFDKSVPEREYFEKGLHIAGEIGSLFKINRVDVINLKTVNHPLLAHNAVFGGRPIFVKDPKIRFALERKIMHEHEDTEYLRSVQSHYLYKHIKEGTFGKPSLKSKYLQRYVTHR